MATRQVTGISAPAPQGLRVPHISPRNLAIFALIALAIVGVIIGGIILSTGGEATSSMQSPSNTTEGPAASILAEMDLAINSTNPTTLNSGIKSNDPAAPMLAQLESEIKLLTKDIATNPKDAQLYWARGTKLKSQAFINNDRETMQRAVEDLTTSIQLDPTNGWARLDRGVAYTFLHEEQKAKQDLFQARGLGMSDAVIKQRLRQLTSYGAFQ